MRYPAHIFKEDASLVASFPDCPGCATQADPGDDLAKNLADALTGWLEASLVTREVPPRPSATSRASKGGRIQWVTVPAQLAAKLSLIWARTEAGLSQAELAKRMGVSQQAIAKFEHPDSNPTIETLQKMADALHAELVIDLRAKVA